MGGGNSTELKELKENQQNINKEFGEKIDENKEILNLILARTADLINSRNEVGSGRIKFDEVVGPRINGHLKNIVNKESYKLSKDPDLVNQSTNVNPRMAKFAKHVLNGCKWVAKIRSWSLGCETIWFSTMNMLKKEGLTIMMT